MEHPLAFREARPCGLAGDEMTLDDPGCRPHRLAGGITLLRPLPPRRRIAVGEGLEIIEPAPAEGIDAIGGEARRALDDIDMIGRQLVDEARRQCRLPEI